MAKQNQRAAGRRAGGGGMLALVLGAAATAVFYYAVHQPALRDSLVTKYTTEHWVEYASVTLFLWALADLWLLWWQLGRQKASLDYRWFRTLESTPGPIPASTAGDLLHHLDTHPVRIRQSWLGQRLEDTLVYVRDSGSAEGVEDQLRDLADAAADRGQQRLAFVRVIAWMVPILGFLGTVLGITIAIANISPEQLENSLTSVTSGLAVAFDTTAVALVLSIALIMAIFLVEQRQHAVLRAVDDQAAMLLTHRFLRVDRQAEPYLRIVRAMGENLFDHIRRLTERQIELWSSALGEIQHANHVSGDRIREDLSRTLQYLAEQHRDERAGLAETVTRLHANQQALGQIADRLTEMSTATGRLGQMTQSLGESLRVVQDARRLEETLHALAGAVHLLTARAERLAATDAPLAGSGSGNAASGLPGSAATPSAATASGTTKIPPTKLPPGKLPTPGKEGDRHAA